MNALKRILTQNVGLKLLALVLAAVVWFLVTNLDDPSVTVRFSNIPVNIRNTNLITSQGKVYEVLDGTDVISSVSVTAPRSIVDTFTKDNIVATADMSNLSSLDTLSIVLTTNKYVNRVESITGSIDTVRLSIEDRKTKTLALSASTAGALPEGYIIGTISTEQNVLRIEGPESAINSVATASVNVDVTGFTTDIDTDAEIDLYDAEGNEINDISIRKNINDVRVTVAILQTKRVPIRAQVTGTPADGYLLTGNVEVSPDTILLAGKESSLRNLDELVISDEMLNVTDLSSNLVLSLNARNYLPNGVSLGDSDFGGQVSIQVEIRETTVKEIDLPVSQITIENIPEGMKAQIQTMDLNDDGESDGLVKVTIRGLQDRISGIEARDISGIIDVAELAERLGVEKPTAGAYTVPVSLKLPTGVSEVQKLRVNMYIEEVKND